MNRNKSVKMIWYKDLERVRRTGQPRKCPGHYAQDGG